PRDPKDPHSLSGTATRARMPNYTIGGKTGTAQQAENGHYSDTHWVGSFIGVTPIEKPKLVVFVAIDTPKKYDERLGKIARYGGIVAAPVAREIARFALPYLGVAPSPGAPYLDKDDPDKARLLDEKNGLLARKAAEKLVVSATGAPLPAPLPEHYAQLSAGATATAEAELPLDAARVPDVRGMPMRVARLRMASAGLHLVPAGSGLATTQAPQPGDVVAKGSAVVAQFVRLSAVADKEPRDQVDADAVEDAAPDDKAKAKAVVPDGNRAAAPAQPQPPRAEVASKPAGPVKAPGTATAAKPKPGGSPQAVIGAGAGRHAHVAPAAAKPGVAAKPQVARTTAKPGAKPASPAPKPASAQRNTPAKPKPAAGAHP
ncbi:MAG: PASTA domain-containing protein, partial [Deltaproteobacteria bacterium]|nr:PASTA domain-containing protein [Deltaproteobacteria bacterium]